MRAIVQRVSEARVSVDGQLAGEIGEGIALLLGVGREDSDNDVEYLADKVVNLRIFEDENGKVNISLLDKGAALLVISQFTLYGDCRKGKRPGFDKAARPEIAESLYEKFIAKCRSYGIKVECGVFQAMMLVDIHNDGPVTLLLDSNKDRKSTRLNSSH